MKKCDKYIQDIADYLDGEADNSLCEQLESHLKDCRNCRIMVDSLRQTIILCRDGKPEPLPAAIAEKLNKKLKEKWDQKFKES